MRNLFLLLLRYSLSIFTVQLLSVIDAGTNSVSASLRCPLYHTVSLSAQCFCPEPTTVLIPETTEYVGVQYIPGTALHISGLYELHCIIYPAFSRAAVGMGIPMGIPMGMGMVWVWGL